MDDEHVARWNNTTMEGDGTKSDGDDDKRVMVMMNETKGWITTTRERGVSTTTCGGRNATGVPDACAHADAWC